MTLTAFFLAAALLLQAESGGPDKSLLGARSFSVIRDPGGDQIRETNRIPYRPRISCFEWVLEMMPVGRERVFSEVLELPGAATDWTSEDGVPVEVAADGGSATVEHRLAADAGALGGSWCLAPGDPLGTYQVTVREGGRVIHHFDFEIVADRAIADTI
jgi:hypothetical protein